MSEKKSIENLFNDALGKAGARPPKGTQEDIKKKLIESGYLKDDESKKRALFWIFGIAILVLFTTGIVWYMSNENKNPDQVSEQKNNNITGEDESQKINKATQQHDAVRISESNNAGENITPDDKEKKDSPENFNERKSDQNKNNNAQEKSSGAFAKPGEPVEETTSPVRNENNSVRSPGKIKPGGATGEKNNSGMENNSIRETGISHSAENAKQDADKENESIDGMKNSNSGTAPGLQDSSAGNSIGTGEQVKENIAVDSVNAHLSDSLSKAETKNKTMPDSIAKAKSKNKFSIDLFAAAEPYQFKYKSSNAGFNALADSSASSESEKISFSAGIGVNIPYKNFFVEPGINYSLLKSDFSYSELQKSIDSAESHYNYGESLFYIYDTLGNPVDSFIVKDSSWVTIIDTSYSKITVKTSNKISIIEIPLWAGYKFNTGKFDFEVKAGASVSFINSVCTTLFHPYENNIVVTYKVKTNSPYRKNYFSLLAAANVAYNINDRFSIFLQPAFKYGLGSIFKKDYPVSKKIQNYSLGAGLRIKF